MDVWKLLSMLTTLRIKEWPSLGVKLVQNCTNTVVYTMNTDNVLVFVLYGKNNGYFSLQCLTFVVILLRTNWKKQSEIVRVNNSPALM